MSISGIDRDSTRHRQSCWSIRFSKQATGPDERVTASVRCLGRIDGLASIGLHPLGADYVAKGEEFRVPQKA